VIYIYKTNTPVTDNQSETIILPKATSNNKLNEDHDNRFTIQRQEEEEEMRLFCFLFSFIKSLYRIVYG
jgi:hypothetical protein